MSDIYRKHESAFHQVASAALVKSKAQIGTIAFKYPKDGAGRLTCYLHVHGMEMVKGTASGGGYDKAAASFEDAIRNLRPVLKQYNEDEQFRNDKTAKIAQQFIDKCSNCHGYSWSDTIRKIRGYDVYHTL